MANGEAHEEEPLTHDDDSDNGSEAGSDKETDLDQAFKKRQEMLDVQERMEQRRKTIYARTALYNCRDRQKFITMMESLIDDAWLGHIEELPGNIYRVWAFGGVLPTCQVTKRGEFNNDLIGQNARFIGSILVLVLQWLGPPSIFLSSAGVSGFGESENVNWGKFSPGEGISEWRSHFLTRLLAMLFTLAFVLNGIFVLSSESRSWKKIDSLVRYMQNANPKFNVRESFLFLGALTNCWVVLWCSIDAYIVLGTADGPKDVLMDALGLIFLYNLDDIGGDLGFVTEDDWPSFEFGWVYKHMVANNWDPSFPEALDGEASDVEEDPNVGVSVLLCCFHLTSCLLTVFFFALLFLCPATPWAAMTEEPAEVSTVAFAKNLTRSIVADIFS